MVHGAREAEVVAVKVVVRPIGHVLVIFEAKMPDHEEPALKGKCSQRFCFFKNRRV